MHFLPTKSQTAPSHLGHIMDSKLSRSKLDSEIETTQFRQAVYLRRAKTMKITNPCSTEQAGYEQIVACFIKNLILDHNSCSATVRGYTKSINMLFHLRNFPIPADFLDWNKICTILILGRDKEENTARQRSPHNMRNVCSPKKSW